MVEGHSISQTQFLILRELIMTLFLFQGDMTVANDLIFILRFQLSLKLSLTSEVYH